MKKTTLLLPEPLWLLAPPARLLVAIQAASLQFRGAALIPVRKSKLTTSLGLQRPVTRLCLRTIQGAIAEVKAQVEAGNRDLGHHRR